MDNDILDKFGKFLIKNLFDKGIDRYVALAENQLKSPSTEVMRTQLQQLDKNQLNLVKNVVVESLTSAIHDFLFAIQQRSDFDADIGIFVDGVNVSEESDGLNGEIFTENGWIKRFSEYSAEIKE